VCVGWDQTGGVVAEVDEVGLLRAQQVQTALHIQGPNLQTFFLKSDQLLSLKLIILNQYIA